MGSNTMKGKNWRPGGLDNSPKKVRERKQVSRGGDATVHKTGAEVGQTEENSGVANPIKSPRTTCGQNRRKKKKKRAVNDQNDDVF